MMKKLLYISGGLALFMVTVIIVLIINLSTVGSYVVKKITGGEVDVSKIDYSYDGGRIVLKLSDLKIKGNLAGTVKRLELFANLKSRPFLKSSTMTDFDLTIGDMKGKTRFLPLPAELLEIKNGSVIYNKQRFIIDELTIENLKAGKPFLFTLKARNDTFLKNIGISGEGVYKGKLSDIKGNLNITGLDLARLSSKLKGTAVIHGPFTFAKQRFSFDGPFEMTGFELKDRVLEKTLPIKHHAGNAIVTYGDGMADIRVENINFLNTSFVLNLKVDRNDLITLDLSSGFVNLKDVKSFFSLDNVARGSKKFWDAIQEGMVKITSLHYEKKKPVNANLELKNMGFIYKDMYFNNVEGLLAVDSHKLTISRGQGVFKSSQFSDAAGIVSLAKDKQVKVKGNYSVNLRDIPSMLDIGTVKFKQGTTQGVMELEGNETTGYRISGSGKIQNADVSWQKISASAQGSYRFTDEEITFDPLIIKKGGTDMVIRGKWGKKSLGIFMKGDLDTDQIKRYVTLPFPVKGIAVLDLAINHDGSAHTVSGDVVMDDISFTIPKYLKKDKGIRSAVRFTTSVNAKQVNIEHLSYNLGIVHLNAKGTISPHRVVNLDMKMSVSDFERAAPLFFFEKNTPKGDLDLDIAFKNLKWPLRTIPHMTGFIRVNNGFAELPWFAKPFKEINLAAEFKGNASEIHLKKLVCDQTTVGSSKLSIEGLENPRFSLSINMDTFNLSDFNGDSKFTISSITPDSIMAKVSGDFAIRAGNIAMPNMSGSQLKVNGIFRDRKLSIDQLTANILGGHADVKGVADLSAKLPKMSVQGKISSITSGLLLRAFGAKSSVIDGEGAIAGDLLFEGENKDELAESLQGNASIYSRDGTIRKWNLLAKVLGLLNLYDLFRGKIHFSEAGLTYTKMGATFSIRKGIFTTNNFLIDSPSMLITGNGNIDVKNGEIIGDIAVSPFVTLDRTIDKIPIIRNLLKEKDKGFFYASYRVTGNIEDPDISTNYVSTIGGRTVDILKNILELPKGLFENDTP